MRRSHRFRNPLLFQEQEELLPPPLPLIKLPEESRLARTGLTTRPTHLPVRRHLVATAPTLASSSSSTKSIANSAFAGCRAEPILHENQLSVETEYEQQEALDPIVERVCVYRYNQPDFRSNAPPETLVFDSLFESGNLLSAERVFRKSMQHSAMRYQEYELMIHPDVTNSAYRQWFYFEIKQAKSGMEYRFSIINLAKSGALFGSGLQPVVYSELNAKTKNESWVHRGTHVSYGSSTSPNSPPGSNTLIFRMQFEHEGDTVYIACLHPYTYTDLVDYLDRLQCDRERSATFRRTEMCQTLAHNSCELLSVTSPSKDGINPEERRGRRTLLLECWSFERTHGSIKTDGIGTSVIVLCARVHPGEPNSSWMMKGMIDYLTGNSCGAVVLRNNFIFKIVPMLNPDGVINGNTRVDLAGWDLNRKWANPIEKLFPTIAHLKRLLTTFQSRDRVAIFCDLHGHSLHPNIFTYGCYNRCNNKKSCAVNVKSSSNSSSSNSSSSGTSTVKISSVKNDPRVFPMIVAKNSPFFSFESCDFKVPKCKYNTARVVVNHELGVINSYTLEASFCGPDFGPRKDTQFSTCDLEEMGQSWCKSLLVYFDLLPQVIELEEWRERTAHESNVNAIDIVTKEKKATDTSHDQDCSERHAESPNETDLLLLELPDHLLSDCEAAISELDPPADNDADDDDASLASDFSDLEEAIPPSSGPEEEEGETFPPELITSTRTEELACEIDQLVLDHGHDDDEDNHDEDQDPHDGDGEGDGDGDGEEVGARGYSSGPEEYSRSIHAAPKKVKRKIHRVKRFDKKSVKLRRAKGRRTATHGTHTHGRTTSNKSTSGKHKKEHKRHAVDAVEGDDPSHSQAQTQAQASLLPPRPTERITLPALSLSPRCRRFTKGESLL